MNRMNRNHPLASRNRKLGRKVLQADRFARALNYSMRKPEKQWSLPRLRTRTTIMASLAVIVVVGAAFGGLQLAANEAAKAERIATTERETRLREKDAASNKCRIQKAMEKPDQVGKVTYDELYDGNECNK